MTEARTLLDMIDRHDVDWNKHTQILELLRTEIEKGTAFTACLDSSVDC